MRAPRTRSATSFAMPNSARGDRQSAPWGVHLGVYCGGDFGVHQMLCTVLFCTLVVCSVLVCTVFCTMVVCTVCIITVLPPCTTVGAQTDRGIAAAASSGNGSKSRCRLSKADHIVSVSRINLTLGQWSKVAWGAGVVFTCQCTRLVVIAPYTDCASGFPLGHTRVLLGTDRGPFRLLTSPSWLILHCLLVFRHCAWLTYCHTRFLDPNNWHGMTTGIEAH